MRAHGGRWTSTVGAAACADSREHLVYRASADVPSYQPVAILPIEVGPDIPILVADEPARGIAPVSPGTDRVRRLLSLPSLFSAICLFLREELCATQCFRLASQRPRCIARPSRYRKQLS